MPQSRLVPVQAGTPKPRPLLAGVWGTLCTEALAMLRQEPALSRMVNSTIFNHGCFAEALARPAGAAGLPRPSWISHHAIRLDGGRNGPRSAGIAESAGMDLTAIRDRDPATPDLIGPVPELQGFSCAAGAPHHQLAVAARPHPSGAAFAKPRVRGVRHRHPSGGDDGPRHPDRPRHQPGDRRDGDGGGRRFDPAGSHPGRHRQGVRRPPSESAARGADRRRRENPGQYRDRRGREDRRRQRGAGLGFPLHHRSRRAGPPGRPEQRPGRADDGPCATPAGLRPLAIVSAPILIIPSPRRPSGRARNTCLQSRRREASAARRSVPRPCPRCIP